MNCSYFCLFCWYSKSQFLCIFCSLKHVLHYFGHAKLPFFPRIADLMNLCIWVSARLHESIFSIVICLRNLSWLLLFVNFGIYWELFLRVFANFCNFLKMSTSLYKYVHVFVEQKLIYCQVYTLGVILYLYSDICRWNLHILSGLNLAKLTWNTV